MSLKDEIATLRESLNSRTQAVMRGEREAGSQPSFDGQGSAIPDAGNELEALLEALKSTLDELPADLDRFPRLTALSAFGCGLALGVLIGRKSR